MLPAMMTEMVPLLVAKKPFFSSTGNLFNAPALSAADIETKPATKKRMIGSIEKPRILKSVLIVRHSNSKGDIIYRQWIALIQIC